MPKMHALTLLSSGALMGTLVGYTIARYGPKLSPVSGGVGAPAATGSRTPGVRPAWNDRIWSLFNRTEKAGSSTGSVSGNQAFDEYRETTLQRLQDEQQEFEAFLDRLRKAKDKEAFDEFLAERSSKQNE